MLFEAQKYAKWLSDVIKFEDVAVKQDSLGKVYFSVVVHNTSNKTIPKVEINTDVTVAWVDEYGDASPQHHPLNDLAYSIAPVSAFADDIDRYDVNYLAPGEARRLDYYTRGAKYVEDGEYLASGGTRKEAGWYLKDDKWGTAPCVPESFSNLTFSVDVSFMADSYSSAARYSENPTVPSDYVASQLQYEFSDITSESSIDDKYGYDLEVRGTVTVTNPTPYYLYKWGCDVALYNAGGDLLDADKLIPEWSTHRIGPGESAVGTFVFRGKGFSATGDCDYRPATIRVVALTCSIDEDKCTEMGVDLSLPEELQLR